MLDIKSIIYSKLILDIRLTLNVILSLILKLANFEAKKLKHFLIYQYFL